MSKKPKPCKPRPGKLLFKFLKADGRVHEIYGPADIITDAEVNHLYDLTLGNPKKAQVLTSVHIK